jgi:hypothetical protein
MFKQQLILIHDLKSIGTARWRFSDEFCAIPIVDGTFSHNLSLK